MAQYSIEIAGPRNDNAIFHPTQQRLRGRWDFANTAHLDKAHGEQGAWLRDLSLRVKQIPGMVVVVDDAKKKGAIIDPLGLPEHVETLKAMNAVFKQHRKPFENEGAGPHPTQDYTLDHDGIKNWLHWMRRMVDTKLAEPCPGSAALPSPEEIKSLPGRRRADPLNTYQQTLEKPDTRAEYGLYPFVDEVAIPKSKEPANA